MKFSIRDLLLVTAIGLAICESLLAHASVIAAGPALTSGITDAQEMVKVIGKEVPIGTPVAKARKFMEGEGFKCSLTKNGTWDKHEHVNYLYCMRTESATGLRFVDRVWKVALIYRDDKIVVIEARTGLVGP